MTDQAHSNGHKPQSPGGSADIVVVGAGVAGLVAARAAAAAGLEVALVDAGDSRPAATAVAAGMIAPVGELTWGEEPLAEAAGEAADAWPAFAEAIAGESGTPLPYRRCGALHVGLDRDEAAVLRRRSELLERFGAPAEVITPSRARELEPGLSPAVSAAVEAPGEAEIDPRALLDGLSASLAGPGVRRIDGRVTALSTTSDRIDGVALDDGRRVAAPRVVVAAGAWASELLGGLGPGAETAHDSIRPVAGEILRLRAIDGPAPITRIVVTERVYLVPRAGGELVIGATVEERGFDRRVRAGGVHELLREAYRAVPEIAELEFVEAAAGLRPGTPDNLPLVGRGAVDGLFVALGLYRHGVMFAPTVAELTAAWLSGEDATGTAAALFDPVGTGTGVPR